MKTIAGCATRVLVNVTAPEGVETELTGYVRVEGESRSAEVQADGGVVFPPLPAGEFLYEIRVNGKAIAWGHLLARMSAFPPTGGEMVDWELAADLTATDAAQITLELLPGARGLTGESAYDAAVEGGFEGTEEEFAAMLAGLPQEAANAAESAADAAASQEAAAASETAAGASATSAGNSATAAAGSATTASTQASKAAASATTAASKATAAANSATAAAGSATEAGISAASAGASAQDAADDAADASTAAATATAQATEATTQAGNAAASATTASQQATAAGNSASAAAGSATTASTKAAEAAGSASTADSKATDAANSANAAAQSAEDAQEAAELLGDAALKSSNNSFTQTNTFNGAVSMNGSVQVSGNLSGAGLAKTLFKASPVFTDTDKQRMFFEPMLNGCKHVVLYAPNLLCSSYVVLPAFDKSIPGEEAQYYYGFKWYQQAETLDLFVKDLGAPSRLKSNAWFMRLHIVSPTVNNHALFRSTGCHPNLRVLHLSTPATSLGVSTNALNEALSKLEEFVLSGPGLTQVHNPGATSAFPGAIHLRYARIYLPKLAASTSLLPGSPLDKDSLLYLMRWLPHLTDKTLTFTVGIDAAMSASDLAEVQAKAATMLDPETGYGWNMVFNPSTYA